MCEVYCPVEIPCPKIHVVVYTVSVFWFKIIVFKDRSGSLDLSCFIYPGFAFILLILLR